MAEWRKRRMSVRTGEHARASTLPVLALRDIVVFPHMIAPLFVGREKSVAALEAAMRGDRRILLLAQRKPDVDDPTREDLYEVGTIGHIVQLLRLPDDTIKVLVEGELRARVLHLREEEGMLVADWVPLHDEPHDERELAAAARALVARFEEYVKLNKKVPPEAVASVTALDDPAKIVDTVAMHMGLSVADRQELLETPSLLARIEKLYAHLEREMELLEIDQRIRARVKQQMEKSQREYYLTEQMKAIQKELGEADFEAELDELAKKIAAAGMPKQVREKAEAELRRLRQMQPMSPEATVARTYLEWLIEVPWKKRTRISRDLARAERILNAEHYGLAKVKERILEHLAVMRLVRKMKGPILCFVGPPGVGKTSLARSIAKATNRRFVRISLGGVRDEAEIRGHRRTYIGALPGKIIQAMRRAGVKNPLMLLDEIDKLGMDFRGDPASALLEVLDPEQNHAFNDHYLDVDYDLSEVMFITTANTMNIPPPLLDRMEVIRIPGYTEHEKLEIARRHLIPKEMKAHGLKKGQLTIAEDAILEIIRRYTREAGVRNLDREIARICRKFARKLVAGELAPPVTIQREDLREWLGAPRYRYGEAEAEDQVGVVTGLAWTETGGELLQIEAAVMPGKGRLAITGHVGDVMQESAQAAFTYVRARAEKLGLAPDFYQKIDVHVHVPEGAIPKDGPSAGIAMATAIASALTKIPVRREVCMTGEITLHGKVLPVGGLKEKLLAAQRGGLKIVLVPEENMPEIEEFEPEVRAGLEIRPVKHMDEVLPQALVRMPASEEQKDAASRAAV